MGTLRRVSPLWEDKTVMTTTIEDTQVLACQTRCIAEYTSTGWQYITLEFIKEVTKEDANRLVCFEASGKLVLSTNEDLIFCHNSKTFKLASKLGWRLVELHAKNKIEKGEFNPLINPVVLLPSGSIRIYASISDMPDKFVWNPKFNAFVEQSISKSVLNKLASKVHENLERFVNIRPSEYKLDQISPKVIRFVESLLETKQKEDYPTLEPITEILGDYSFGVEIEAADSNAPITLLSRLGFLFVYDGSLSGRNPKEYVSIPLRGFQGLATLYNAVDVLNTYCSVNLSCSLHVTLGNLPKTKEFICALYILYYRIQEDILDFMPEYIRDPVLTGGKRQNYADRLTNLFADRKDLAQLSQEDLITTMYARIARYYLGEEITEEFKGKDKFSWGDHSWHCSSRYVALNLLKAFHKDKERLVEFRAHPPTLDRQKIFIWLTICASILNYAHKHTSRLINSVCSREKFLLTDVLEAIPSETTKTFLLGYVGRLSQLRYEQRAMAIGEANLENGGLRTRQHILREFARKEIEKDQLLYTQLFI